jgi:hypothetical protein
MRPFWILALCGACAAQLAKAADQAAGEAKPVEIAIKARGPYRQADGSPFTPSLTLRCEMSAGKAKLTAILSTAGIETAASNSIESFASSAGKSGRKPIDNSVVNYSEERPFHDPKMKFDDGKAVLASRRLNVEKEDLILPAAPFIKSALAAHMVTFTFPALGESNQDDVVSQFDLSGFKAEWDQHPECAVK